MNPSYTMEAKLEVEDDEEKLRQELKLSLPKELLFNFLPVYFYQGFWSPTVEATIALQSHFQAQETDIFITSFRKAGTTWLKSLLFSICNRAIYTPSNTPLLTHNAHDLIPQLESNIYARTRSPDLTKFASPRLFGTHLPFLSLPESVKGNCGCKIIYICRNPLDLFISSWKFYSSFAESSGAVKKSDNMMEHYFDMFCEGKFPFGPYEDHVLGYWRQSLEQPDKVLFIKYEDLKADCKRQLKRVAEFVGCPFSVEEEAQGVADGIVEMCSIQKLKEVEVNKNTNRVFPFQNQWFFRKGEVGDWVNYLTPAMAQRVEKIMAEKLRRSWQRSLLALV